MHTSLRGLLPALALILGMSTAQARTWFVNPDGSSNPPTIQAAIQVASPGDTVALADGVFSGNGNRDLTFLGKGIVLRSVSGHPENCVIDAGGSHGNVHRGIHLQLGDGPSAVIQGITLQHGYVEGYPGGGGGILCDGASPTIRNCIFTANHAITGAGLALVVSDDVTTVSGCLFVGNDCVGNGAGIGPTEAGGEGSVVATDCRFENNVAGDHGGGVALYSGGQVTNCVFVRNHAASGGAFYYCNYARSEFLRCTFLENTSQYGGAGTT
jgi:hypothetical protein